MTRIQLVAFCFIALISVGCDRSEVATESQIVLPNQSVTFYSVDHYDVKRNATEDLVATIQRATEEDKRILLQIGGDWCIWCQYMTAFMESNKRVHDVLNENFIIMKVTWEEDSRNEEFLSNYPTVSAYPHLFVLESDGTFLHSQGTGELEEGQGYNEDVFAEFLESWKPIRP